MQLRKCNQLIRKNTYKLDQHINTLKQLEAKAKAQILASSRRAQKNPSQAKQAALETRVIARELIKIRKQSGRLYTSKAQLQSVGMQVNEAFSVRRIQGSIQVSTGIMKDVNSLVRLPELTGTMRELSMELMKAGIIEEMVTEDLFEDAEEEDEEAEVEVDKVLGEILKGKIATIEKPPQEELPAVEQEEPVAATDDAEEQRVLDEWRERLQALKS
jgi:charged multivesicular body protein 3